MGAVEPLCQTFTSPLERGPEREPVHTRRGGHRRPAAQARVAQTLSKLRATCPAMPSHESANPSVAVAQCSLTCGSVRRVISRANVSSATFVYPCSASSCSLYSDVYITRAM